MGQILAGATAGAAGGAVVGGPVGAAVGAAAGGIVGGAVGGVTALFKGKTTFFSSFTCRKKRLMSSSLRQKSESSLV